MAVDIETYKEKAQIAIESVYRSEYHNSLGIPMPEVKMLLPDDKKYIAEMRYVDGSNVKLPCFYFSGPNTCDKINENYSVVYSTDEKDTVWEMLFSAVH